VNKDLAFGLDIALREPGIIEGKPLMKAVQKFADLISEIVPKFKPLLT
jgi:hypothetical protein